MPHRIWLHALRWRRIRGVAWRGGILFIVFACALLAFRMGTGTTERAGIPETGILAQLYYTLGLFVLGGLDLGIPSGGTALARGLLWFAYFAAPAITALSVIEGVLRAVAPERWRMRRIRGHVVIAGCSRISMLYLRRLRERSPGRPVVVVELTSDHAYIDPIRELYQAQVIIGDIRSDAVLAALQLDRASRVMLMTSDDFANLDAATKIHAMYPALARRTVVHLSDLRFMRVIKDTAVARSCTTFNRYQIAAEHLVRTVLLDHFEYTQPRDIVVIAGFGRFGQSVLSELQERAAGRFDRVVLMDFNAEQRAAVFEQQTRFADFYQREVLEGDLRDPRLWQRIQGLDGHEPVFLVASGEDGTNLRTAMWLKAEYPEAFVLARSFDLSSFAEEVSREANFHAFSVADLVIESMPRTWYGRQGRDRRLSESA